jgi:chaperonin cofactor prefoldin
MVFVLAVVGASAYLYLSLRENNINLSQVPDLLQSITALDGRMDATEAELRDLAANWDGLTNHLAELDGKVDSSLRATRNQARELVGQAAGRLQAEMDQQGQVVDARLNTVESMQRQDRAQLAQLNDQLQGQVASLREQLTAAQESTGRDLANLQGQVSEDQSNLHTLAQRLHRDKVTFEIVKDSPTELAPGVTLTVLNTDVSYQRFRGYISLTNEGKTLWLNNLNAKEAVDLYAQQYSHPYSLIVTTVSKDGVVGYLPLPTGA